MTEDQIERRVESMVDHLDHAFLSGAMSQGDYDKAMRELDQWAEGKRREELRKPYHWRGTLNGV